VNYLKLWLATTKGKREIKAIRGTRETEDEQAKTIGEDELRARILRVEESEQGALGVLIIDGVIFCFTLEPDRNEKGKLYIPQGVYHCQRFHGTKWPDTFEIQVPGHTAVLFHSGNTESDTLGCVLLGATTGKLKGARAVLNSGQTFKDFLAVTASLKEFGLFIEDRF
jgi:hypothetical protein